MSANIQIGRDQAVIAVDLHKGSALAGQVVTASSSGTPPAQRRALRPLGFFTAVLCLAAIVARGLSVLVSGATVCLGEIAG
jgi:hypothetical protein